MNRKELAARVEAMERELQQLKNLMRVQEQNDDAEKPQAEFTGRIIDNDYRLGNIPARNLGCLL